MDYVTACQNQAWHLQTWPKIAPDETKAFPFRCRSWRCQGECRQWRGAQDFARIKVALESHSPWMHVVLTYQDSNYPNIKELFRLGLRQWAALRKRTQRRFGDYFYIQTWETTRRGVPHCHMSVANLRMWRECGPDPVNNFHRLMRAAAVDVGFGPIGWVEPIRDTAAMAGYLTKLARELTGQGKDYQIPVKAPRHFRRLRASRRLLPKPFKNEEMTGCIWFCNIEGEIVANQTERDTHKKIAARTDAGGVPDFQVLGHSDPEIVSGASALSILE